MDAQAALNNLHNLTRQMQLPADQHDELRAMHSIITQELNRLATLDKEEAKKEDV